MNETAAGEFAEQIAATLAAVGFPRMAARVMMALMTAETGQATAEELMTRLGASAAAISGAVRMLQQLALVRRRSIPGTRRHLYELPEHAWYQATSSQQAVYSQIIAAAEHGLSTMEPGTAVWSRTEEMVDYFRFISTRMPQLGEEWRASRGIS